MTSQKDIQSLIADIDSILPKVGSRLPWSKPSEATRFRQVLERIRRYLVSLQQNLEIVPAQPPTSLPTNEQSAVQQILQAVTQEIDALRTPLQAELGALRAQRESLIKEIRQLEETRRESLDRQARQKAAQEQVTSEFAQDLINRSTERLTQQLGQILVNLEAQLLNNSSLTGAKPDNVPTIMLPQERLEYLRQLQMQFDQMLLALDSNQRVIFEALERNLYAYHQSLSVGLDKMHRLGNQGEMLFTALVNRLAQQLGREASTIWQSAIPPATSQTECDRQLPNEVIQQTAQGSSDSLAVTAQPLTSQSLPIQPQNTTETPPPISHATPAIPAKLGLTPHQSEVENLNTQEWEMIEGLEVDELDESDRVDTFIQLDIPPQDSLSTLEDSQDLDLLFDAEDEQWTGVAISPISETPTTQVPDLEIPPDSSSENLHPDIDELYESLFGVEALSPTAMPDELYTRNTELEGSQSPDQDTEVETLPDDQSTSTDFTGLDSAEAEDFLFGITDPATEPTSSPPLIAESGNLPKSGENFLFEDAKTPAANQIDLPAFSSQFFPEQLSESESVETITSLTDLLAQMGLSYSLPIPEIPGTITGEEPELKVDMLDSQPQAIVDEDHYIPASPEEDLLPIDESNNNTERQILLAPNTLEQLSEDLHTFEEFDSEDTLPYEEPPFPGADWQPRSVDLNQTPSVPSFQHRPLPMSEELLAEDWEEFALHDLANEDTMFPSWQEGQTELTNQALEQFANAPENLELTLPQSSDSVTPDAPELIDSELAGDSLPESNLESKSEEVISPTNPEETDQDILNDIKNDQG